MNEAAEIKIKSRSVILLWIFPQADDITCSWKSAQTSLAVIFIWASEQWVQKGHMVHLSDTASMFDYIGLLAHFSNHHQRTNTCKYGCQIKGWCWFVGCLN